MDTSVPPWYTVRVAPLLMSIEPFAFTIKGSAVVAVAAMLWEPGLMDIDVTVIYTVAVAVLVTDSELAVIVAVPTPTPVRVALPVPLTVAIVVSLRDQDTPLVA